MKTNIIFCIFLSLLVLSATPEASQQDYKTAYDYTVRFYPRWFTWVQAGIARINSLGGPIGMGPDYKVVVAINDDTVYAQAFLDLTAEPQIVTIPPYSSEYSVIILDVFGNIIISASMPTIAGATYALVGPNFTGTLPNGITAVKIPYDSTELIFRIDTHSPQGLDLKQAASQFRSTLRMQGLSAYQANPLGGKAFDAPLKYYGAPIKSASDELLFTSPTQYLNTLQQAMSSPATEPLSSDDQALISQFNTSFNAAKQQTNDPNGALTDIITGAQAAHTAIIDNWKSHIGSTNWIHFGNMGHWGTSYLDRSSANEYIQYGNDSNAAYYAHAFVDWNKIPLDGSLGAYTITFTKGNTPAFSRFVSITAYTPEDIELVANSDNKYVVASYTPGLVAAADGSVTIYVQPNPPLTAPKANWLPVPSGPFNLMLRVYGPQGTAKDGTYIPPAIQPVVFPF